MVPAMISRTGLMEKHAANNQILVSEDGSSFYNPMLHSTNSFETPSFYIRKMCNNLIYAQCTHLNLGGTGPEVAMLIFYEMVVSYYDNASLVSFVVFITFNHF